MSASVAQLTRRLERLAQRLQEANQAAALDEIPSAVAFSRSIGIEPDPWQANLLSSTARNILLNCSRQSGKSTTVGTLVAHQAIYQPGSQTVIGSPGERQGNILLRKIKTALLRAGYLTKANRNNEFELTLTNGSGILVLPGNEATSRGPSGIDLLIMEEAARAKDALYLALLPMLATRPNAREIHLSTPFGARGFFYDIWKQIQEHHGLVTVELDNGDTVTEQWEYFEVPAEQCPRISAAYLAKMKRRMGAWWFEQEFHCQFLDALTRLFGTRDVDAMLDKEMDAWDLTLAS